jgi:Ca2+/Na+ antiporter
LCSAQFLALAIGVVIVTRYLVLAGLAQVSQAYGVSGKLQGQLLGYATSVPELVGTSSTALRGLLGAGLWNVAASNIINCGLFLAAALYFRRGHTILARSFADEICFALAAVAVPLVLATQTSWARSPWTAALLLGFFAVYLLVDRKLNPEEPASDDVGSVEAAATPARGLVGIALLLAGLVGIVLIGHFLGAVAEVIVVALAIPEAAVGWVLGVVTSLPEMTTFFVVFSKARGASDGNAATQRSLDNLAASNMSNIGIIYPIGITLFLFATT